MKSLSSFKYLQNWLSLIALLALLVGCGASLPGTPLPTELRGQWQTAFAVSFSDIPDYMKDSVDEKRKEDQRINTIVNMPDGLVIKKSTLGIAFYFFPDGRYEHVWLFSLEYSYSCIRLVQWKEQGTVGIAGTSFSFRPARATFAGLDNCEGIAVEAPARPKAATIHVTPDQDPAGWPLLRFGYPSGELVLEKCRTCK